MHYQTIEDLQYHLLQEVLENSIKKYSNQAIDLKIPPQKVIGSLSLIIVPLITNEIFILINTDSCSRSADLITKK